MDRTLVAETVVCIRYCAGVSSALHLPVCGIPVAVAGSLRWSWLRLIDVVGQQRLVHCLGLVVTLWHSPSKPEASLLYTAS